MDKKYRKHGGNGEQAVDLFYAEGKGDRRHKISRYMYHPEVRATLLTTHL